MTTKSRGNLLTLKEVAGRLRFHEGHVRRLVREKKLAVVRLGAKAIRVAESDLDDFIESHRE